MLRFVLATLAGWLAALASTAPTTLPVPLPPSQDPFYTAPAGFALAAPGDVLRVRPASGLAHIIANCSAAYNVLYRTTDSNYRPAWAVTTLLVPAHSTDALVSYQISYDSASVDMSPSYTLYSVGIDPSITVSLSNGWSVSVPDYEGPHGSFTAGGQAGHATIDAVRAVLRPQFGLGPDAPYALWGYSGGALASEWAAELQVQYAPEMHFAGIALGGLTPNPFSVLTVINRTPYAQLIVNGVLGLASQHPAAEKALVDNLKTTGPYNATGFMAARHQNTTVDAAQYANQDIFQYFTSGAAVLNNSAIMAATDTDGIMGYHGVPAMPVFAYKAINDELSPVADTDALLARFCSIGANILYQRNTVGGHLAEAINGAQAALEFVGAVLHGSYNRTGCTIQNVTIAIDTSPE